MAASPLLAKLRQAYPDARLVITTVTETGNSVAKKIANDNELVLFLPFDISFIVKKVISYIKPLALIIVETEIWPNLIIEGAKHQIPIFMVNGRISDESFGRYKLVRSMLRNVLNKVRLFLMQSEIDKDRIVTLGAPPEKVSVAGNVKFDKAISADLPDEKKRALRLSLRLREDQKLFVVGSTHLGEEEIILSSYLDLKKKFNNLQLLIAPRHPERADEICSLVFEYGFTPIKVSELSATPSTLQPKADPPMAESAKHVFLLDTVGQLRDFYSIADIVFVGGSLVKKGGQNMIEPAFFSKPILFGEHTFNFRDITKLFLKQEAAIVVKDKDSLVGAVTGILGDQVLANKLSQSAREIVNSNSGAVDKTIKAIHENVSI